MLTAEDTFDLSITWLGDLKSHKKSPEYMWLESYVSQNDYSTVTDQEEQPFEIKRYARKPNENGPIEYLEVQVDSRLQLSDLMIESIFVCGLVVIKQLFKESLIYMRRIVMTSDG